jgi:hypothetical protein
MYMVNEFLLQSVTFYICQIAAGGQVGGYLVLLTAALTWISQIFKKYVFTFSGGSHYFFLIVVPII